jgi:phage/plasmid-associated DNA primase
LFRQRGFAKSLDKDPIYLGVGNGVLELGNVCKLIDYYHEIPVSQFTPAHYRKFDPNDPYTKVILDAFRIMIPEKDMRIWILFFFAQCLSGGVKEGILLLWYGGGANGKTFIMRLIAKVLGKYATKLNISLLTSERESADKPNSAVMQVKGKRFGYVEETKKAEILNDQRVKELANAGEMSARDLNSKQECFEITANIAVGQNYDFIVKTKDHGTWRRLRHYTSKVKFDKNPNPDNPFEYKDDPRFIEEYVKDPNIHAATLSILVYFYERLQNEYNGSLKKVDCQTLNRETEIFRNEQDPLNTYITEHVVISPGNATPYSIEEVGGFYLAWRQNNVTRGSMKRNELIEDITNSALQKYIKRFPNKPSIIKGIRILETPTDPLEEGEKYMGFTKVKANQNMCDPNDRWWEPDSCRSINDNNIIGNKNIDRYDFEYSSNKSPNLEEFENDDDIIMGYNNIVPVKNKETFDVDDYIKNVVDVQMNNEISLLDLYSIEDED